MKYFIGILLCLGYKFSICQNNGTSDIIYGNRIFQNKFYNQVNTTSNYKFTNPVQIAGIGYSGRIPVDGRFREGYLYGHWSYAQVIPQQITVSDTIRCNINGYMVSIDVAGFGMFKKSKAFHLIGSTGFNTGRLRLHGNEWTRQKNPFFSPKIALQPRFLIGKVVLSLVIEYELDISSQNWRRTYFANKNKVDLEKFHDTGITTLLCIGLIR